MKQKIYVTTPIYYVNDVPHVGTLYTTLAADVLARYYRLILGDENVFFITGTDEHGQKIAQSAQETGLDPQAFADSIAPKFEEAWKATNLSYDYFMRTTNKHHKEEAQKIFKKIYDAGYIYKGLYEGEYCVGCEKFITESDTVNGRCPLHPNKDLIHQREENYFFKLGEFAEPLLKKIIAGEYQILPDKRRNEIVSRIKQGVEDISISRESVSWGIPVPWDEKHTFYVWVEALFYYYTATQYLEGKEEFWPPDVQFVGKDILWFHAFIWEALLVAAELPLPKTIFAHGFFTINGQKMSKSLGNVISPAQLVEKYGTDGTRYLLLSAFQFGSDGDLSLSTFDEKYNADLANGLGNLVQRVAKLAENSGLKFETKDFSKEVYQEEWTNTLQDFYFDVVLSRIWLDISIVDQHLNYEAPWLQKDKNKLKEILQQDIDDIIKIALRLKPFLPDSSTRVLEIFSAEKIVAPTKPLFPRIT